MAGLSDAFGSNSAVSQIFMYQVAGQIVQALLAPTMEIITEKVNSDNPVVPLSPADLATLVVRNYRSQGDAGSEAAASGINSSRFADMVSLASDAPAPGDLATALRRGLIGESGTGVDATTFEAGIREGRIGDKWITMLKDLAVQWPSPTDALDALLEGQISHAEAADLFAKFGGAPQFFDLLFNTRGSAPTPVEALTMANRGIIPWTGTGPNATSYEQAFLEGPWRNKWEGPYRALGEYLPPPRTVTTMITSGALTPEQGTKLLIDQGLTAELAAAYVHDALDKQTATDKEPTVAMLLDMYSAGLIASADVKQLLSALKYSDQAIAWLISYRDLQRAIAATNAAVSRIHTLYVNHKIDAATANGGLTALSVPAAQTSEIIAIWSIERATNIKTLSPAEIADAWKYQIIGEGEALNELMNLGYTSRDAWIYLSIKAKGPIGPEPAPGPTPVQGNTGTGATP